MRVARPATVGFHLVLGLLLGGGAAVVGARSGAFSPWLGLAVLALVPAWGLRKAFRRARALRRPLPASARAWLEAHVPLYRRLGAAGRLRFERDVRIVLAEARFEAVGGEEPAEELRLGVAAGVALLLHGRPDWELDLARTFLFYPDTFDDEYLVEAESDYDGMVHPQGPVLLSARAVREGWEQAESGSNVVLHELAHLFDFGAEEADGVPSLLDPASRGAWLALARREMALARRGRSMLGRYAATHPAEFFAVAVERFFGQPEALSRRHPELFETLVSLFQLDPRAEEEGEDAPAPAPSLMARRWHRVGE